jgi:outer membrane porin, OprD family
MEKEKQRRLLPKLLTAVLTAFLVFPAINDSLAVNTGYISDENPAPSSAKEIESNFEGSKSKKEEEPSIFPTFKEKMDSLPQFWRDTNLNLHLRTYYFYRDNVDSHKSEAWALGGWLEYESGWWRDRLQIGLTGYTSQELYGPDGRDGTLLLRPKQQEFSVLGQAYLTMRIINGLNLSLYRQTFDKVPYVNKQDSRMVPNTFEAYSLIGLGLKNTNFIVSHVTKMKTRNASSFEYMSEVAGYKGTDKGLTMGGARYKFSQGNDIGAITQYAWDLWNTFYAEANATWEPSAETDIRLSLQHTDQRSVGDELAGDFDTYVFGGKVAASCQGAVLSFAFSTTDDEKGIRNPWGGYPGYLSLMVKDFYRADEDAWLVGLSYDFSSLGLGGLSSFFNYANGDTPDSGNAASPDQEEFDITIDYRFKKNFLKGMWLRLRYAYVDQNGPDGVDVKDFRAIVNYELNFL